MSERLKEYGYNVRSYDLIDRNYGDGVCNFFDIVYWNGDILTNPPYKYAQKFIEHALEIIPTGNQVFMFLRVQFLEGKKRRKLFDDSPPKFIYVSSGRIMCAKNAQFEKMKEGGGSAMAYAWFHWVKGFKGDTVLKWIN